MSDAISFSPQRFVIRQLGRRDYMPILGEMKAFTDRRSDETQDEIWVVEHAPVFTLGLNGKREHLLAPGDIPVIATDRGGQVTYHGPGQAVVYFMIDVRRRKLGVRQLVTILESSVIELLAGYGIVANSRPDAPGVYVSGAKVASLGLRIRRGCSYHGLALNIDMDLEPFLRINPCGYADLTMTQLRDLGVGLDFDTVTHDLVQRLLDQLGYGSIKRQDNDNHVTLDAPSAHMASSRRTGR